MNGLIEEVLDGDTLIAIIVRSEFSQPGVHFFTDGELSQQLAYMSHPAGKVIDAHFHNPVPREVTYTQETLFLRKGLLRVDLYRPDCSFLCSRELHAGDVILLVSGGHGFEALEPVEMFEVKQGPHVGECDKTRFEPVGNQRTHATEK